MVMLNAPRIIAQFLHSSNQARYIVISIGGDVKNNPSYLDVDTVSVWESDAQATRSDFNDDDIVNICDMANFTYAWLSTNGSINWSDKYDLALPQDDVINFKDFAYFAEEWINGAY